MQSKRNVIRTLALITTVAAVSLTGWAATGGFRFNVQVGSDANAKNNPLVQPQDPAQSGGNIDQSLQFGDDLIGTPLRDLLIGRLGSDLLIGGSGPDILLGGTEHFNPANRDRAFGGPDNDMFLWAPGDGSDAFDGGPGDDVVIFGLIGEVVDGNLHFGVSLDQQAGEIFHQLPSGLPIVEVTNSPGFCEVIDDSSGFAAELDALGLDHLVRFFVRSVANDFANGVQNTDNGLRVTLHLDDVEFLVCTSRDGGAIEAFDLRQSPPVQVPLTSVPVPSLLDIVQ